MLGASECYNCSLKSRLQPVRESRLQPDSIVETVRAYGVHAPRQRANYPFTRGAPGPVAISCKRRRPDGFHQPCDLRITSHLPVTASVGVLVLSPLAYETCGIRPVVPDVPFLRLHNCYICRSCPVESFGTRCLSLIGHTGKGVHRVVVL